MRKVGGRKGQVAKERRKAGRRGKEKEKGERKEETKKQICKSYSMIVKFIRSECHQPIEIHWVKNREGAKIAEVER